MTWHAPEPRFRKNYHVLQWRVSDAWDGHWALLWGGPVWYGPGF